MSKLDQENINEVEISSQEEAYFSVSTPKFILMSLGTLGLYKLYWQYKNWNHIKNSKSLDIMPFWRAFFAPLWAFSLFTTQHPNIALAH